MEIKMETASLYNGEMEYARFGVGKKFFIIIPGLSIKNILKSAAIVAESYKIFAEEYPQFKDFAKVIDNQTKFSQKLISF